MVEGDDGPVVIELELIEPVLFLDRNSGALDALVAAVARALSSESVSAHL